MAAVDEFYKHTVSHFPEKENLHYLSAADSRVISELRHVMQGVHSKGRTMEREMGESELTSESANPFTRLGPRMDMYGNSSVNEKPHQRLPHSRKLSSTARPAEPDMLLAGYLDDHHFYSRKGQKRSWDLDDLDLLMSNFNRRRHVKRRGMLRRQSSSSSEIEDEGEHYIRRRREQARANTEATRTSSSVNSIANLVDHSSQTFFTELGREEPNVPTEFQSLDELNRSHRGITEHHSGDTAVVDSDVDVTEPIDSLHLSILGGVTYGHNTSETSSKLCARNSVSDGHSFSMKRDEELEIDVISNTAKHSLEDLPVRERLYATDLDARVGGNETKSVVSLLVNTSFKGSLSKQLSGQIVALLTEIDRAKDLNIQLHDKLLCADAELEAVKQICRDGNVGDDCVIVGVAAAMVQELWQANYQREQELARSLHEVLNERDDLLDKLENLKGVVDVQQPSNFNLTQKPMKSSVATSTAEFDESVCNICHHSAPGNQQSAPEETVDQKMKGSYLQEELLKLQKEQVIMEEKLNIFEKRQLLAEDERDFSLAKVAKLEEELSVLQQSYRLQNPLPDMLALHDAVTIARAELEWTKGQLSTQIAALEADKLQLINTVNQSTESNSSLKVKLSTNEKAMQDVGDENNRSAERKVLLNFQQASFLNHGKTPLKFGRNQEMENCRVQSFKTILERLVNILRKKISILGANVDDGGP